MPADTATNSSPSTSSSTAASNPDQHKIHTFIDKQESIAGSQYTSIRYSDRLRDAGALASIGTVGDSYDNSQAESLIGLYKTELVTHEGPWRGLADLELGTANWVHWFNTSRLHSSIGYVPPIEYETVFHAAQQQPREAA